MRTSGGECLFTPLDVTSEAQWQSAIAATVARFGRLDILVNNAGVSQWGLVHETSESDWNRVMDINAKGTFLGTKAAIPAMLESGGGSIINISSQLGLVGTEMSSPQYQSSKGAVRLLTKLTAMQYAKYGIRCNSVHPGPIMTPMTEPRRADAATYAEMLARIPLGTLRRAGGDSQRGSVSRVRRIGLDDWPANWFWMAGGPLNRTMRRRHRRTLEAIYRRPTQAGIRWAEIESLLLACGATIEGTVGIEN